MDASLHPRGAEETKPRITDYIEDTGAPRRGIFCIVHPGGVFFCRGDGFVPEGGWVRICVGVGISAWKVNNSDSWKMMCWVRNADLPTRRQTVLNWIVDGIIL